MEQNPFIRNPQLPGETFFLEGNDTGILLFHGYTATTAEVRLMADCLHQAGYTVSAPLLPGHGTHPEELNAIKWMDWYEAAEKAYFELKQRCKYIFVGGESMGALPAIFLASRYTWVDGLLLFAPAIKVPNMWLAYLVKPFKPWLIKSPNDDGLPWKGYNVYPVKGAIEFFKMQKVAIKELSNINQPTLIFTGAHDHTIAPESGQLILERIASREKKLIEMKDSPHCILLDHEVGEVCRMTREFIEKLKPTVTGIL